MLISIFNKKPHSFTKAQLPLLSSFLLIFLIGCGQNHQSTSKPETPKDDNAVKLFVGCYTVANDEPAQIKISQTKETADSTAHWIMQMREDTPTNDTAENEIEKGNWDTPEPLEILTSMGEGQYFSVDNNQIDAIIARPDKMMVIAHVKQTYVNIDPLLDSEYLAYIYKGANSLYKVECEK